MQKWEWALLLGMVGTVCCSALAGTAQSYGSLEQNVLRLHILANSDSIDDQALKLKVRDKVLAQTETLFRSQPENAADAEQLVAEHLETLEQTAQQLVWDEGYSYAVKAQLVEMPFDDRTYGKWTMPAGDYEALRITIGEAAGQNWWCVMYPHICFIDETIEGEDKEIKHIFSDEEYNLITGGKKPSVAFKTVEIIEDLF